MKPFLASLALGAVLACASLPATADMQETLGPLAGLAEPGQDGPWMAEDGASWFTLTNTEAAGEIRYYWMELPADQGPDYTVAVNLAVQNAAPQPSYAGILFDYEASDSYTGVTIGSDGAGWIFTRTPEGFQQMERSPEILARNDGSDVMVAHVTGNKARFEVNGETLLEMDSPDGFARGVGIIAIGQGQFGFNDFTAGPPS